MNVQHEVDHQETEHTYKVAALQRSNYTDQDSLQDQVISLTKQLEVLKAEVRGDVL